MSSKSKLLAWEVLCVFWIAIAGSLLHFAFELSEYWKPMALIAAVNESIWEHVKMYFWPGLAFAVAQYTYTRGYANNYWLGKFVALAVTPCVIISAYQVYMMLTNFMDLQPSLAVMLSIMFLGIAAGQLASWRILSARPFRMHNTWPVPAGYAVIVTMFSTLTYFPPKAFLFENFACYQYTGEYGILEDYEPYRIFTRVDEDGVADEGAGMNYCAAILENNAQAQAAAR